MSALERHPVWKLADEIQQDARRLSARIVALRSYLASLDLPDSPRFACDRCGGSFPGALTLSEHVYFSHGGPEPSHWLEIEAMLAKEAPQAVS